MATKLHVGKHQEGGKMPDDWRIYDADGNVVESGFETQAEAQARKKELENN